jgi:hypothetical protein
MTTTTETERRMTRGKGIAPHPEVIERTGPAEWSVPSQNGFGRYRVWCAGDLPLCSYPDYDKRVAQTVPAPCKHIYAILDLRLHKVGHSLRAPERKPRKQ